MEALIVIIVFVVVLPVAIFAFGIATLIARVIFGWLGVLLIRTLPMIIGIGIGLVMWENGSRALGNLLVAVGFLGGSAWFLHAWGTESTQCSCFIHRLQDRAQKIIDDV